MERDLEMFLFLAPWRREGLLDTKMLEDVFTDEDDHRIVMLLAKPSVVSHPDYIMAKDQNNGEWKKVSSKNIQRLDCGILKLPDNLLLMIIGYMIIDDLSIGNILRLGLTCHRLWLLAWPTIIRAAVSSLGTWVDTPIICVSKEMKPGSGAHFPIGLLSNDELKELDRGYIQEEVEVWEMSINELGVPVNLFDLAAKRFEWTRDFDERGLPPYLPGLASLYLKTQGYCPVDLATIASTDPKDLYRNSADEVWILRNLTARQFIRSTSIALSADYINGPFIRGIGFGGAIFYLTAWSNSPGWPMEGEWAGDSLDIVPLSRLKEDDAHYTDIGDRVAPIFFKIWTESFLRNYVERMQIDS
ncbi:hypothetical protein FQN49_004308 [Arthroderma sp. PD_2]|nr:hypothetical protein FQN49_004308 [Arthroderma sp. PD_2]